jgi:hypothetical protein
MQTYVSVELFQKIGLEEPLLMVLFPTRSAFVAFRAKYQRNRTTRHLVLRRGSPFLLDHPEEVRHSSSIISFRSLRRSTNYSKRSIKECFMVQHLPYVLLGGQ